MSDKLQFVVEFVMGALWRPRQTEVCRTFSEEEDMKLLNLVGWSSMAIIPKARQTEPAGVIVNEHTLTASQTRLHVETLSRWFDFIHYDELLGRLSRPR